LYYCLGEIPFGQGQHTFSNKALLPQVLIEFHPISYIQGKNSIKDEIVISQARFRQQFSNAKFIKGGKCKLQLSKVKFKLGELSPSSNMG
jgi:hypothetical protein